MFSLSHSDFLPETVHGKTDVDVLRQVVSRFLADGLLKSDSHKSDLRIGFPMASLKSFFPNLYPEAATTSFDQNSYLRNLPDRHISQSVRQSNSSLIKPVVMKPCN